MNRSARPGAVRRPPAPKRAAASIKRFERLRVRVPEGETDAERQASVTQRMEADGVCRWPWRRRRGCDQQIGDGGAEDAWSVTFDERLGARLRPMSRDGLQQSRRQLERMLGRDRAERRGVRCIAAERHLPSGRLGSGAQPDVGRHGIEMERAAAIDHHRDFRPQHGGEGCGGEPLAQSGGEARGVDCLVGRQARRADR